MALSVPKQSGSPTTTGTPQHFAFQAMSTPGTSQVLLNIVNANNTNLLLNQVIVVCSFTGSVLVTLDGEVIGSGRTGVAENQLIIPWKPPYTTVPNQNIQVIFQQRSNSPPVSVEAYLNGSEILLF